MPAQAPWTRLGSSIRAIWPAYAGQIARIEEPKRVQGACAGIEIAFDNAGTLDLQMTDHTALDRKIDAVRIGELQVEPHGRPAGSAHLCERRIERRDRSQG